MTARYSATELSIFAYRLLTQAGLEPEKAHIAAEVLVEGDLGRYASVWTLVNTSWYR